MTPTHVLIDLGGGMAFVQRTEPPAASAPPLLDIERAVLALHREVERLRKALNRIAAWDEGPEVTDAFDSPWAARIAREALAATEAGCGRKPC